MAACVRAASGYLQARCRSRQCGSRRELAAELRLRMDYVRAREMVTFAVELNCIIILCEGSCVLELL